MKVAVLHPGEMGASIAAAVVASAHDLLWCAEGRSDATLARAEKAGLGPGMSWRTLVDSAEAIISVCPPEAASTLAQATVAAGFKGLYVDANAVAPQTAVEIAEHVTAGGADFVDGGIIGPPAWAAGSTRLYLSGERAEEVAAWFDDTLLAARAIAPDVGAASGLKMAYAAWTKGSSALLLNVRAMARSAGVESALLEEWDISQPGVAARSAATAAGTAPKAWRFVGEMEEIAATFDALGLPGDFHLGAAAVYYRMRGFKGGGAGELDAVLAAIAAEET